MKEAERARLVHSLRGLPDELRAKVESIDFTAARGDLVEHLRLKLAELGVDEDAAGKAVAQAKKSKPVLKPDQALGTTPALARTWPRRSCTR